MGRTEQNKRYYATHGKEVCLKRKADRREIQDKRLLELLSDHANGLTIKELCDKYKVLERKAKNV